MIYLDYNATTPLRPEARAAMLPYLGAEFGNPSSVHRLGSRARVAVENARAQVARLIGARASEIVFTSGGTEANNMALFGIAAVKDGALVTTTIEHSSVLASATRLEEDGRRVHRLDVDRTGRVDLDGLRVALQHRVALVSVGWANNEIGTIQPIAEITALCRAAGAVLHVDAVQAVGKIPVVAEQTDVLSLSAHKLGGPKGVGALWVRGGVALEPRALGGGQERGRRSGTENVAGIVGFGAACQVAVADDVTGTRTTELRERLWDGLAAAIGGVRRNSPRDHSLPNTLNVCIEGVRGEALVAGADIEDVAISTGSACAAGAAEPSHVLRAIGLTTDEARDGVRFSLGRETTVGEIDRTIDVVAALVAQVRRVQPREVVHV